MGAKTIERMVVAISWMNPLGVWSAKRKGPKTKFWRASAFIGCKGTEKPVNGIEMVGVRTEEKTQEGGPSQKPKETALNME